MKMRGYLLVGLSSFVLVGCNGKEIPVKEGAQTIVDEHDHKHDDGHGHDQEKPVDHSQTGHSHGAGPHGGVVADWGGGKFHVEVVFDHAAQTATAYVLGGDEKTPVPIDAATIEITLKDPAVSIVLKAELPADGAAGKASKFVGIDDAFGKVQEFEGAITGVIDGTPYTGEFKE
jgi:ABC-type Zn2+ transport system substrate-binding protein/surface adhesin